MREHHRITKKEVSLDETLDLRKSLKVRVLSKNGEVIGKVSQIRIHPSKMFIEGVVVGRGIFRRPIYIGASYIKRLSNESFILDVNPSVLLKRKLVLDSEGMKVGKVKGIIRKEHSNEVKKIIVTSPLRQNLEINISDVKYIGENLILSPKYNVKKKYIWSKS